MSLAERTRFWFAGWAFPIRWALIAVYYLAGGIRHLLCTFFLWAMRVP